MVTAHIPTLTLTKRIAWFLAVLLIKGCLTEDGTLTGSPGPQDGVDTVPTDTPPDDGTDHTNPPDNNTNPHCKSKTDRADNTADTQKRNPEGDHGDEGETRSEDTCPDDGNFLNSTGDILIYSTFDNGGFVGLESGNSIVAQTDYIYNFTARDIFSCSLIEQFRIPEEKVVNVQHLVIAMNNDQSTTSGALVRVQRQTGDPVFSGEGVWEVCATDIVVVPTEGPTKEEVDQALSLCNFGEGGSTGWLPECTTSADDNCLAVGEPNQQTNVPYGPGHPPENPGNLFPDACSAIIGADARWMMYKMPGQTSDPFKAPSYDKLMLFRLDLDQVTSEGVGTAPGTGNEVPLI